MVVVYYTCGSWFGLQMVSKKRAVRLLGLRFLTTGAEGGAEGQLNQFCGAVIGTMSKIFFIWPPFLEGGVLWFIDFDATAKELGHFGQWDCSPLLHRHTNVDQLGSEAAVHRMPRKKSQK